MAIPKILEDLSIIQKLSNLPNETDGLSAERLKAAFDEAPLKLQQYINEELVPYLEGDNAATGIGIADIEGVNADNVQKALEILKGQINEASTGAIPDNSIVNAKLRDKTINTGKIADGAVTTSIVADGAVTNAKIASVAASKVTGLTVDSGKISDNAVTTAKVNNFAITEAKIGAGAVTEPKIGAGAVTRAKLAANAVTDGYTATIGTGWTGSSAPYSITVTVTGIVATDMPIIDLNPSDTFSQAQAQIEAFGYIYRAVTAANSITFYATDKPTVSIPVKIKCIRR